MEELDCLGMKCPRPIIERARRITTLAPGDRIVILADDPAAGPDLAAWCRMRGHTLITSEPPRFVVEKQ